MTVRLCGYDYRFAITELQSMPDELLNMKISLVRFPDFDIYGILRCFCHRSHSQLQTLLKIRQTLSRTFSSSCLVLSIKTGRCSSSLSAFSCPFSREKPAFGKYLKAYLLDGRLEISNNRAENSIRPFVMGRKNWLFSNTPNGARASAIYYSLIISTRENGFVPFEYLTKVFTNAPNGADLESLLPWCMRRSV